MIHTLYGIGKKLLLVIALMLIFFYSIQAQNVRPKEYYTFWQEADLYILEQIVENFSDEIGNPLTKAINAKIDSISDDTLYTQLLKKGIASRYSENKDFVDDVNKRIGDTLGRSNESIYFLIDSLVYFKGKIRDTLSDKKLNSSITKFKEIAKAKIDDFIKEKNEIKAEKVPPKRKVEKDFDEQTRTNTSNISTPTTNPTIYFIAGFLLLGLVALFFLFYMLRKNLNNKIAELQAELSAFRSSISRQFEQKDTEWGKRNRELQNAVSTKINDTQRDLDDLYRRVQQYESNQGSKPAFNQSYADSVQSKPAPPPPPPPKRTITYYLPGPDPSGYFWNDKKSSTPDGSSIYQLVVEEDNQSVGELSFYKGNEKSIKMALSNPSLYIKPVCQSIDNIYSGSTIEMKSPGRLQLSGDKWIIVNGEKMKISIR